MQIKDVMTRMVIKMNENDSLLAAAQKMANCEVGALPVTDNKDNVMGIITDRDIVVRACTMNWNLKRTRVKQVMSTNVQSCQPEWSIEEVANMMADLQIRRMPVVDANDNLIGFVALADLAVSLKEMPQIVEGMLSRISMPAKPKCEAA